VINKQKEGVKMSTKYQDQALNFLRRFRLTFKSERVSADCPPFCDGKHIHGDKYKITIGRKGRKEKLTFPFWNSLNDKQNERKRIPEYDALACISSDSYCPETFEEFCNEYGYDSDSRKAFELFELCKQFMSQLNSFFTDEELDALQDIR